MSRSKKLLVGKANRAIGHTAPFYFDDKMHDLNPERIPAVSGYGPIKSSTFGEMKKSLPYLPDGRCLTPEDTVEFLNRVPVLAPDHRRTHRSPGPPRFRYP